MNYANCFVGGGIYVMMRMVNDTGQEVFVL